MKGWVAILVVLGCAVSAPVLGWLVVQMILPKSRRQRTEKRDPEDPA